MRFLWLLLLLVFSISLIAGYIYLWPQIRGAWIAFRPTPQNVDNTIENEQQNQADSHNTTGLPLTLPPGFSINYFAQGLESPRVLVTDPQDVLVVSLTQKGSVVALPDRDSNGEADETVTLVSGLNRPHGLAFSCRENTCQLYVAQTDRVSVYDYDQSQLEATNGRDIVSLPSGGQHVTRSLLFLPPPQDHLLLVSIGSSCNVCLEEDSRRASVQVLNTNTGTMEPYATGLRNAVFMTIRPATDQVWVTEMGRDFLGDNLPPDEINILEQNQDYGWPFCYGKQVVDSQFNPDNQSVDCQQTVTSHIDIPAHSAPLGLDFFPTQGWPEEYQGDLLVAYHGSWSRTQPTGYKVVRFELNAQGNVENTQDFITGWLTDQDTVLGRPVAILTLSNGSIYISDDRAGVIYRVTNP